MRIQSPPDRERPSPVRVCIVAPTLSILGGQAVQAERLLTGLRETSGVEVDLIPINPRLPGVLAHLQRIKYLRTALTELFYVTILALRLPRYHTVHVFSASYLSFVLAPTPAILLGRLYRKRVILNYHSGEAEDHLSRWHRTAIPTIRLANEIVVPSKYLVDVFAGFGLHALPISNTVELERFRFRERRPLRPLFLANRNFEAHYNVASVLRAFALIQEQYPEARLLVVGDGSQRAMLHALARDLNLKGVEFFGQVPPEQMHLLYDQADLYLNASTIDNMPTSIIEAFAAGLPVVTTNAGGIPYLVRDGETGLMVQSGDHRSLAQAAIRLLRDGTLASSIVSRARQECLAAYHWEAVRDQWISLYQGRPEDEAPTTGGTQAKKWAARPSLTA